MFANLLALNGYGEYVWPAFIFTLGSCVFLYLKTKKELQKQEKIYLKEFKQLENIKVKVNKRKEITKEALSGTSI